MASQRVSVGGLAGRLAADSCQLDCWVSPAKRVRRAADLQTPNHFLMNVIEKILRLRNVGNTMCSMVDQPHSTTGPSAVDHVVQAHGLRGIAADWIEISAADAHAIVTTLLHRDLAFQGEIMPLATASELATQFFDPIPEPHAYFTNAEWTHDDGSELATLHGWTPISDATFDSGVVCLGDGRAALLWMQDED